MTLRSWKDVPITLGFVTGLIGSLVFGAGIVLTAGKWVFVERAEAAALELRADSLETQISDIYKAVNQSEIDRTKRAIAALNRIISETRYRTDISDRAKDEIITNTQTEIALLVDKIKCLKAGKIDC